MNMIEPTDQWSLPFPLFSVGVRPISLCTILAILGMAELESRKLKHAVADPGIWLVANTVADRCDGNGVARGGIQAQQHPRQGMHTRRSQLQTRSVLRSGEQLAGFPPSPIAVAAARPFRQQLKRSMLIWPGLEIQRLLRVQAGVTLVNYHTVHEL
jgi:hypothetical protein